MQADWELSQTFTSDSQGVRAACVFEVAKNADAFRIVTGNKGGGLCQFGVRSGDFAPIAQQHNHSVTALLAGDDMYATGCEDAVIRIMGAENHDLRAKMEGHEKLITSLAWATTGGGDKFLVSGSCDGTAKIWNVSRGTMVATLPGHENSVCVVGLEPTSESSLRIATGSAGMAQNDVISGHTVRIWTVDVEKGTVDCEHSVANDHEGPIQAIAATSATEIATASRDGTVKIRSATDGTVISTLSFLHRSPEPPALLSVAPVGDTMVAASAENGQVVVWNLDGEATEPQVLLHSRCVWNVIGLPNGDIATCCDDGVLRIFTRSTGRVAPKSERDRFSTNVQIAILQQTIQRQDAALQSKDAALQSKDAELQSKDAEIYKKDAEIYKKDAEIYKNSYDDMVNRFGGIPDMPKVAKLKPHQHAGSAPYEVDSDFVTDGDLNFEIKSKDKDNLTIRSFLDDVHLDDDKNGTKSLSYENEATVADYVQRVVTMCLKLLGYFEKSRLHKEMSLFSLRPDLILVKHKTKGIILIIEVKMPGDELFASPGIAKQVADYLVLQYRLGNTMPFVLLSSYREACLCHLDPDSMPIESSEDRRDKKSYREIVDQAVGYLKEGRDANLFKNMEGEENDQNPKPVNYSPDKVSFAPGDIPESLQSSKHSSPARKRARRESNEKKITIVTPGVVYSKSFNLQNMVHGVSLAIACGLVSLRKADEKTEDNLWPKQMSIINGLYPQVESEALQWASVVEMPIDYMKAPFKSLHWDDASKKYILLQEIGRGKSGKVFLAVDYYGAAVALKFYLGDETECYSHRERLLHKGPSKEAKKGAEEEADRWKTLQGDYEDYTDCLKLNRHAVVVMPVFAPVPPEERNNALKGVKDMLTNFLTKGYLYREVRWQHVGCRKEKNGTLKFALLDLESLLHLDTLKNLVPSELAKIDLASLREFISHTDESAFDIDGKAVIESQIDQLKNKISVQLPGPLHGMLAPAGHSSQNPFSISPDEIADAPAPTTP